MKVTTMAEEKQSVALEGANRDKEVAELQLEAAQDRSKAILSKSQAERRPL
ncbi:MAG: hypothetical protein R3C11_28440 [Planctomycetaceae bacterium]